MTSQKIYQAFRTEEGKTKYGIITIGSQGDIDPFIALGKRLQSRGHYVRIAAFCKFEEHIRAEDIDFISLAGDAAEVIRLLIGEQIPPFQYFHDLSVLLNPIKDKFLKDVVSACEGMDAILYSLLGAVAWHVADKLNIPCFRVFFFPADPTVDFPAMTAPNLPLGHAYNKLTFTAGDLLWTHTTCKLLNDWRVGMGLSKIHAFPYRNLHGKPIPTLYAYSPLVAPKPASWDENKYLTGYWVYHSKMDWHPDESLVQFIDAGSKPIYIGFGSMVGGSFEQILNIVLESLRITNQRAVLSAGWGNLRGRNLPEFVHQVGFIPHEWIFKRVSAVVHHGGAGTTASGLSAGVPTIVVPFGGDQPFWGNRVYQLGAGPKPIMRKELNANRLAAAISETVRNQEMAAIACHLGEKLRAEDGVENAVSIIEQITKPHND